MSKSTTEDLPLCRGRRRLLRGLALGAGAGMLGMPALGAQLMQEPVRELAFANLHTGERLHLPYWERGVYIDGALDAINQVLRDHRSNKAHAIDTALLDLLHRLQSTVGNRSPFEVISGYRAPESNEMLRASGRGVAKGSMHVYGKAIDVRLPGTDLLRLHAAARSLKGGGVGLYRASDFIHVDTGRVRYW